MSGAESLPSALAIADVLAHQSRLNVDMADVLHRIAEAVERGDETEAELRGDVAMLGVEVARLNDRVSGLTETVGRLMLAVEPLPPEPGHSVKVT